MALFAKTESMISSRTTSVFIQTIKTLINRVYRIITLIDFFASLETGTSKNNENKTGKKQEREFEKFTFHNIWIYSC